MTKSKTKASAQEETKTSISEESPVETSRTLEVLAVDASPRRNDLQQTKEIEQPRQTNATTLQDQVPRPPQRATAPRTQAMTKATSIWNSVSHRIMNFQHYVTVDVTAPVSSPRAAATTDRKTDDDVKAPSELQTDEAPWKPRPTTSKTCLQRAAKTWPCPPSPDSPAAWRTDSTTFRAS